MEKRFFFFVQWRGVLVCEENMIPMEGMGGYIVHTCSVEYYVSEFVGAE